MPKIKGREFAHFVATVVLFLFSVYGDALPTSAREVSSTDGSMNGRPVGFARIVEDGLFGVSQVLESFEMWDITAFCTHPSGRSHSARDFESKVRLQVEAKPTQLIFETDTMTDGSGWSTVRSTESHAISTQQSWEWRHIQVTFENAMQWSHAGPGGQMIWLRVELSIALQDPQLPSGEPIWKFYQVTNHWSLGIGAISGQTIYNPLIPPGGAQGRPFTVNSTESQSSGGDQTA